MKKTSRFTLIEMLVVIAIIGILSAIIYPALMAIIDTSYSKKTEAILTSVNTAIKTYKNIYGVLPSVGGSVQEQIGEWSGSLYGMKPSNDYYTFFDILTYKSHSGGDEEPNKAVQDANPRRTQFLDPQQQYFSDDDTLNSVRDAWDRPLIVFLDHDGDERVKDRITGKTYVSVAVVLSMGDQEGESASSIDKSKIISVE